MTSVFVMKTIMAVFGVILSLLVCGCFASTITISEETQYVDNAYELESNFTLICSVCLCNSDRLSNPYEVNCQDLQLDGVPDFDPFLVTTNEVNNVHLKLQFNYISIVDQLKESSAVDAVLLDNNAILGIDPFAFAFLPNLKYLSLSNNQLSLVHPNSFSPRLGVYTSPIEVLDLSYNRISHLDADIFDELRNLVELNLRGNPIGEIDSSSQMALSALITLTNLNLADTGLATIPMGMINMMKNLEELNLESNRLQSVPDALEHGEHIIKLTMDRNPIPNLNKSSFKGLRSLQLLSISFMPNLEIIHSGTFHPLSILRSLSCHDNYHLSSIDEGSFNNRNHRGPSYLTLELSSNNLTYLKSTLFDNIEIELLDVRNNSFYCDCNLAWIRMQKMPKHYENATRCAHPYFVEGKSIFEVNFESLDAQYCKKSVEGPAGVIKDIFSLGTTVNNVLGIGIVIIIVFLVAIFIVIIVLLIREKVKSPRKIISKPKQSVNNNTSNSTITSVPYTKLKEYHNEAYENEMWDD